MNIFKYLTISALGLAAVTGVHAQPAAYPNKPVRILAPFAPGGGNDLMARTLANEFNRDMGERFVVENARRYLVCRAGWMMGAGPAKDKKFIQKLMQQLQSSLRQRGCLIIWRKQEIGNAVRNQRIVAWCSGKNLELRHAFPKSGEGL